MRRVVLELPSRGATGEATRLNELYAKACLSDVLRRGEAPLSSYFSSHVPDEVSVEAHVISRAWITQAHAYVVYQDRGVSDSIKANIEYAEKSGIAVEIRSLPPETVAPFLTDRAQVGLADCRKVRLLMRWLDRAPIGSKAVYWTGNLGQDCNKNIGESVALRTMAQRASAEGRAFLIQTANPDQNGIDYCIRIAKYPRLARTEWDSEY